MTQTQTVSTVYNFAGGKTGGQYPWYVTLVQATSGVLYGVTEFGGPSNSGAVYSPEYGPAALRESAIVYR